MKFSMKSKRHLKKSVKIFLVIFNLFIFILIIKACIPKKEKIYMDSFLGKTKTDIDEFCKINKCTVNVKEKYDLKIDEGKIISQSIKEKTELKENSEIEIVVSKGVDLNVYKEYKVNELGRVPIMMYHGIIDMKSDETNYTGGNVDKDGYQRTYEAFIEDLEFYYKNDYRMIRLEDYINGKIDVPLGKSPIVLTFDDGLISAIKVTGLSENGEIIIDPHSAIGILESFKKKYPDFQVTATFFVNGGIFKQPEYNDKIVNWMIKNGYDIGNHTYSHADLTTTTESGTIKEIGSMYKILKSKTDKYVNIVALPYGSPYSDKHINFKHVLNGLYDGEEYSTLAALRVGWESNYSPFSTSFDKQFIKRIRAYDNNGKDFDIEYNFDFLKKTRYISDGNSNTVVVPKDNLQYLKTNLKIINY